MAFKGPIEFPSEFGSSTSSLIADAIGSGLSVTGIEETAGNFRDFSKLALFMTGLTSKKTAEAILKKALRHTPYDTGDLFDSGFVSSAGDSPMGDFPRPTVIDENIEGTVAAYAKGLAVTASFQGKSGFYGNRTFVKYVVGFTADHAVLVHENPIGMQFRQETNSPFDDTKMDHFLLLAYQAYEPRFSNAMRIAMKGVQDAVERVAMRQAQKLGAPRLVKRSV